MKKLVAALLIVTTLFSIGIINSCSCAGSLKGQVVDYSTKEAVNDTKAWLASTYTKGDMSIVNKYLKYYIVPSENNSPCFVRYSMGTISARDLLVFKGGQVIVIDEDTFDEVRRYNEIFSIDVTRVTDMQIKTQKGYVTNDK